MTAVTLYTRPGCHLCETARDMLTRAARGLKVVVQVVNVDEDPVLAERYGERIPVVSVGGVDVLAWPFTQTQARQVLAAGIVVGR